MYSIVNVSNATKMNILKGSGWSIACYMYLTTMHIGKCIKVLLKIYQVQANALQALVHLTLSATLRGRCHFYPQLTSEGLEASRSNFLGYNPLANACFQVHYLCCM